MVLVVDAWQRHGERAGARSDRCGFVPRAMNTYAIKTRTIYPGAIVTHAFDARAIDKAGWRMLCHVWLLCIHVYTTTNRMCNKLPVDGTT